MDGQRRRLDRLGRAVTSRVSGHCSRPCGGVTVTVTTLKSVVLVGPPLVLTVTSRVYGRRSPAVVVPGVTVSV